MATKKRKVYFYRLNLIHHRDIDKNTVKEIHLTNVEIEKKFQYIYDKKTSILSSGRRAIILPCNNLAENTNGIKRMSHISHRLVHRVFGN